MNIRPLHNRIVVKPIKTSDNRVSAKENSHEGEVCRIPRQAPERRECNSAGCGSGQRHSYGKYTGSEIKLAGKEYLIVRGPALSMTRSAAGKGVHQ